MATPPSHAPGSAGHLLASSIAARRVHGPPVGVYSEQILLWTKSGASRVLSTVKSHGGGFCAEVFAAGKHSMIRKTINTANRTFFLIIQYSPIKRFKWFYYGIFMIIFFPRNNASENAQANVENLYK